MEFVYDLMYTLKYLINTLNTCIVLNENIEISLLDRHG